MNYFRLYANCLIVKGIKRSIICDLQKLNYQFIPNDLSEIIMKSKKMSLTSIFCEYGNENKEVIEVYFKKLLELDLGFFCSEDEINNYPELNLDYLTPFKISNCIIEYNNGVFFSYNIIQQLEKLGCEYIEIIDYTGLSNDDLINLLKKFNNSSIKHIGLIIKYDNSKKYKFINSLVNLNLRLSKILVHSAIKSLNYRTLDRIVAKVDYIDKKIEKFISCGNFKATNFTVNINHFTESQHHNTCLNRKISIDKDGNIKNCPSMPESFGNIKDTTLEEALNKPGFKKYWNINKDQIEVCKDCEFRHICTDCRAYTEDPENQYSKPLKCGYNPYTNVWEEWSTNPLKQKAIEYYGMRELVKKDA